MNTFKRCRAYRQVMSLIMIVTPLAPMLPLQIAGSSLRPLPAQPDPEGIVWLAGAGGLNRYDPATDSWESIPAPEAPADLHLGYVTDLVIDPEGDP